MSYAIGDQVRVISLEKINALPKKECCGHPFVPCSSALGYECFVEPMWDYAGKVVTIKSIDEDGEYQIEESDFFWADDMFESES